MKQLRLTNEDVGALCLSLAHLYHAGIGGGDALALMAEDEPAPERRECLAAMSRRADEGASLSVVFREAGCFPTYVCALLEVGERAGKTEETLNALAQYYERRALIDRRIRTALLYPAVLTVIMLAVVVILLVWVLPVFNDVYAQLGSRLTGVAGGLLVLGSVLRKIMPLLCVLLGAAVVAAALLSAVPSLRERLAEKWSKARGDKGVNRQINTARFAQALTMGMSSGMAAREAVELAAGLAEGSDAFEERCRRCMAQMDEGASLAAALREAQVLSGAECRLLEAGLRSGSGEKAMEQIARRRLEESEGALEAIAGRVEPTLVVVMSVLVGVILLSVMLPLMHIMTAIG